MLTLLSECHFWTSRDEIRIKSADFGAFKYSKSRDFDSKNLSAISKREYIEKRDGNAVLKNHKSSRLKDNVKKLEELMKNHKIVQSEWKDSSVAQILFSNGILVHICVDIYTGDIIKMAYDKYFIGKLAADVIADAVFTRHHILLAYKTNQITVVYLQKPNMRKYGPEKISNMDPKIFHVLIPGPFERKLSRRIVVNKSFDLVVVWTKSSQNEVYPWRPTIRDQDRANIHVFKLRSAKLESFGYCWTENDPLCVEFLRSSESQILTIEQRVSRKGEITAEICSYEVSQLKMQRTAVTSIPVGSQICCQVFSPDQEKLFVGTIDRNVYVHDLVRQTTKFAPQIDIIPTKCVWHPDSGLIIIANERSQFQCFDIALTSIANQLISEDVTPSNLLDLSHYFTTQPNLLNLSFSCKPDLSNFSEKFAQTDCFLLLIFENGPIGCLRFFSGAGMSGDIHNSGLTPDVLVNNYLLLNQFEKAVNLFLAINWETYGAMCLISLHKITNHVLTKSDVRRNRIEFLSKALKTFNDELSEETKDEFSDQVFDLKRRFFFFLLRYKLYSEAFEVAQGIEDYDLFMDIFNITKNTTNLSEISKAAFRQAEIVLNENENSPSVDVNSLSSCSHSSCSDCTTHNQKHSTKTSIQPNAAIISSVNSSTALTAKKRTLENFSKPELNGNNLKNYVPPLPSFKSPVFNAENVKINIPKPELRISNPPNANRQLKSRNPPLPNLRYQQYPPQYASLARSIPITEPITSTPIRSPIKEEVHIPSWNTVPDQTLGIPTLSPLYSSYIPNNVHKTLPRSGPSNNNINPYSVSQPIYVVNDVPPFVPTPRFYQHPLVSGTIPPTTPIISNEELLGRTRKPAASILSNSSNLNTIVNNTNNNGNLPLGKKDSGEKNKVKFSDTVQVAVVPEIPRKEKPLPPKRNGYIRPRNLTNPQKELADSLPLCHPHGEYLKDFNPISELPNKSSTNNKEDKTDGNQSKNSSSIKVVHFGVV